MLNLDKITKKLRFGLKHSLGTLSFKVGQVYIDFTTYNSCSSVPDKETVWHKAANLNELILNGGRALSLYLLKGEGEYKNPSYDNNILIYLGSISAPIEVIWNDSLIFKETESNIMLFFLSGEEIIFTIGNSYHQKDVVFPNSAYITLWPKNEEYLLKNMY